jgi:hypothetical protein
MCPVSQHSCIPLRRQEEDLTRPAIDSSLSRTKSQVANLLDNSPKCNCSPCEHFFLCLKNSGVWYKRGPNLGGINKSVRENVGWLPPPWPVGWDP